MRFMLKATWKQPPDEEIMTLLPAEEARAKEFAERLESLADEFASYEGEGPIFGFAGAVYRTAIPGEQP